MKQKKGLGSIPKGLQWIGSDIDTDIDEIEEEVVVKKKTVKRFDDNVEEVQAQPQMQIKQQTSSMTTSIPKQDFEVKMQAQPFPAQPVQQMRVEPRYQEPVQEIRYSQPAPQPQQQQTWQPQQPSVNSMHPEPIYDQTFSTDIKGSSQKGLQEGWTRATFILKQDYIEKLKAVSYWERMTIKEVIDEALSLYLQNKDIQDIPKRRARV